MHSEFTHTQGMEHANRRERWAWRLCVWVSKFAIRLAPNCEIELSISILKMTPLPKIPPHHDAALIPELNPEALRSLEE